MCSATVKTCVESEVVGRLSGDAAKTNAHSAVDLVKGGCTDPVGTTAVHWEVPGSLL